MIYADHAATTALSPFALAAMEPWLQANFGNPSTLYSLAREPRKAVLSARETIASCIGAKPEEIYFTSGGTEADNWALQGIAFSNPVRKGRIITSTIEHHAVLNTCAFLKKMGFDVVEVPVDRKGVVSPEILEETINDDTILVSVMTANNEIGTIQPIKDLAEVARRKNCVFHSDAVQAIGHIPVDVKQLNVDMLSSSAHKFNGPKGVGFLYIRDGVHIEPFMHGGGQEGGRRAGTENVPGIIGMAAALKEHHENLDAEMQYLNKLVAELLIELRKSGLDFIVNGSENRIPGSLNLSFGNADGEMLLHRLDLMGTTVATGSACNSESTILSHVIKAIGVPERYAYGTIRITFGMDNTTEDTSLIVKQLVKIIGSGKQ